LQYHTVKNFDGKKFGEKGATKDWQKNFGKCWLASTITNHWLTVKWSWTNQFQILMNVIKWTPCFSGFVLCYMLVACCSMMVRLTVESMICSHHEYISKLSLKSELDLLKYCNIDILTSILIQNKLKHTSCCCMHLMLRKMGNGWKKLVNCCDSPNLPKFFPSKVFYCTVMSCIVVIPDCPTALIVALYGKMNNCVIRNYPNFLRQVFIISFVTKAIRIDSALLKYYTYICTY